MMPRTVSSSVHRVDVAHAAVIRSPRWKFSRLGQFAADDAGGALRQEGLLLILGNADIRVDLEQAIRLDRRSAAKKFL